MIKRTVLVMLWIGWIPPIALHACDACGCSINSMGIGLWTDYSNSSLRLGYSHMGFSSHPEHAYAVDDRFSQWDITWRMGLGLQNRIKLQATLPYGYRSRMGDIEHQSISGIGDVSIAGYYAIINNKMISERSMLYVEGGIGISAPTGQHDPHIQTRNLPENFNIGRGGWGQSIQLNASLVSGRMGLITSQTWSRTAANEIGYTYGNQYRSQLVGYREIGDERLLILPNIGVSYEHIRSDRHAIGVEMHGTGGYGLYASAGINIKATAWTAGLSADLPVHQYYSDGEVEATPRVTATIAYIIPNNKYTKTKSL